MKIAILGAGYAGLAVAYHLLQKQTKSEITLFDPHGIGGGASGIAAGLLHSFTGVDAKLSREGREAMRASKTLLDVAAQQTNTPVFEDKGILRLALTPRQEETFKLTSEIHPEVEWIDSETSQKWIPGIVNAPGIFIKNGLSVYSKAYLDGLWIACEKSGAVFSNEKLTDFSQYDHVIITMGIDSLGIQEASQLPLRPVKGQLLELSWPSELSPLPLPLNANIYLVMHPEGKSVLLGGSYERENLTKEPDQKAAVDYLLPRLERVFPALVNTKVLGCRAGIRATTPDRMPILKQLNSKMWVLSGFGSKGLLYHALYAEKLAASLLQHNLR